MTATVHEVAAANAVDAANAVADAEENPGAVQAGVEVAHTSCRSIAAQRPRRNWEEGPTTWSWSMSYDPSIASAHRDTGLEVAPTHPLLHNTNPRSHRRVVS